MKKTLLFLLLALSLLPAGTAGASAQRHKNRRPAPVATATIPQKAIDVYLHVLKSGTPPEGYVGGRRWENREHRLPPSGNYREFDVNPKVRGKNRGAERIIVDDNTKKGWYTADHYRTFIALPRQTPEDRRP